MQELKGRLLVAGLVFATMCVGAVKPIALTNAAQQQGVAYNSWPMIGTASNRLVCAYSRGKGHNITEGVRGVFARISVDGGCTWSAETCVADAPDYGEVTIGKGQAPDGALLLWVRCFGGPHPHHDLYRTKDGLVWEKIATPSLAPLPMQITDIFPLPNGLMCLWFAGDYRQDEKNAWGTLFSRDGGKTWQQRTIEVGVARGLWPTEPSVVVLPDGRLLALARTEVAQAGQLQLTSVDDGKTWQKTRTNITDVMSSTPSLIYDAVSNRIFNYYYERGKGFLKCRVADASTVFLDPTAWSEPEIVTKGSESPWDSGNVNAVALGARHALAYYSGKGPKTDVFVCVRDQPAPLAAGVTPVRGTVWQVAEWAFTAARDYTTGGGDALNFDIVFEHPATGCKLLRPAFWDGGATFKVRFAPTATGTWKWTTRCADDATLNGRHGTFESLSYKGALALYRHGFVKTVPGQKYFTYADGTPFFYLGDTHWGLYREEIDQPGPHAGTTGATAHFKYVVKRRAEQGFTVLQSEPIGCRFDVRDGRVDASDIAGFQQADRYYQIIAGSGLVHANAEFFFASEMRPNLAKDNAALERLCRYWSARFGAYPVIWTLAQEIDNDFYHERKGGCNFYTAADNPWVKVADYLHKHDAYQHPLSGHQENTGHTTIHNSVFVSPEVARKVGHSWWAVQWSPSLKSHADTRITREYWQSERPAVNYEGRYCYLWTKDFGARAQGWISFLNGFCGYGYGAIDMWLYQSTYNTNCDSHDGIQRITVADKAVPWCQAIEFPSAKQMGIMRTFLEKLPWWKFKPDLGTGTAFALATNAVAAVASIDRKLYVGYFYGANVATGHFKGAEPNRSYEGMWFNPRTGESGPKMKLQASALGELPLPNKPDTQDWVLLVSLING